MVEIKKELTSNVQCTICANATPQTLWTIISPSKPFFHDVSAWVSQIAATQNMVNREEEQAVELSLCDRHNVLMNQLLPNTLQSKREVLDAFRQIHECYKN